MTQYSYDKWLRPKLNTQWQNIENQKFVDYTLLANIPVEEEEDDPGDEEEIETSEETSDADRSVSEVGNESIKEEDEDESRHNLPWRDGFRLGDDDIVARFVTAMEDQDPLHPDSISRLKRFFKTATLEDLEEASREVKEGRILLEDRNFSRKCFRPYPRSMTPKQLHEALAREVRIIQHNKQSELTKIQRYPAKTPPRPAGVETRTSHWGEKFRSSLSIFIPKIKCHPWSRTEPGTSNTACDSPKLWTESEDCQVEKRTL